MYKLEWCSPKTRQGCLCIVITIKHISVVGHTENHVSMHNASFFYVHCTTSYLSWHNAVNYRIVHYFAMNSMHAPSWFGCHYSCWCQSPAVADDVTSCSVSFVITGCLQVLEELQKVKDECKNCETKNESLQSELEVLRQKLTVSACLLCLLCFHWITFKIKWFCCLVVVVSVSFQFDSLLTASGYVVHKVSK